MISLRNKFKSLNNNFMKSTFTLLFSFLCLAAFGQVRYLDAQFEVNKETDVTYGTNIGVITGMPAPEELEMDIYTPKDDTVTTRPVILIAHTGSFLPPIINGQATGSRNDGTVVYMAEQLAARGFVVAAYSYRLGWNPVSTDQDVRTSTLLQAAYRGIQDTRNCVRYFRNSVALENNPYGIDPDKIGVAGIGTGGYLALGAGTLYQFEEVTIDKFISQATLTPYIDSTLWGNIYGDTQALACIPNYTGYSSEIAFSFNIGGAMGDSSWVDGDEQEAAISGVHATSDIFAPYTEGNVIVPTTNEFVVQVAGTRAAVEYANQKGNNDIFNELSANDDPLSDLIDIQKETDITLYTMQTLKMGTDNFYAFATPFPQGSPWDWWDKNVLDATVAAINMQLGTNYNSDEIHMSGLATNPDMSPMKGQTYLDSCFMLMLPRACVALDLGCYTTSKTKELLTASDVNLVVAPNPASEAIRFTVDNEEDIQSLRLYDINGKLIRVHDVNNSEYLLQRDNINSGVYLVQLVFESGLLTDKVIFK
jgi:hypothetical protein